MDPLSLLGLAFLFGGASRSPAPAQVFRFPRAGAGAPAPQEPTLIPPATPAPAPPAATPAPPEHVYVGVPVGTQPAGYRPYAPLTQDVIATAQQVLRSRTKSMLAPDKARPGNFVLYQAEYYPGTTRRKVTAWRR